MFAKNISGRLQAIATTEGQHNKAHPTKYQENIKS